MKDESRWWGSSRVRMLFELVAVRHKEVVRRPDMVTWAVQALLSRGTKLARLCRRLDDSYHGQMFSSRSTLEHDLIVSEQHVHMTSAIEDSHPLPCPDLACTVRSPAACSAVQPRDRTSLLGPGYPVMS
jgi:hypothetical protein